MHLQAEEVTVQSDVTRNPFHLTHLIAGRISFYAQHLVRLTLTALHRDQVSP